MRFSIILIECVIVLNVLDESYTVAGLRRLYQCIVLSEGEHDSNLSLDRKTKMLGSFH